MHKRWLMVRRLSTLYQRQGDVDIIARGVGVGAHHVSFIDQRLRDVFFKPRQADFQLDFDAKPGGNGANADVTVDLSVVRKLHFLLAGDMLEGAQEAGRITRRKQLFGVGAVTARATEFLGRAQFDVQRAV